MCEVAGCLNQYQWFKSLVLEINSSWIINQLRVCLFSVFYSVKFCMTCLYLCFVCLTAALLQEHWEALALRLSQTQEQIRACESAMVFAFVEVIITL